MALFEWARPDRGSDDAVAIATLRKDLRAEHTRLARNLRSNHDRLLQLEELAPRDEIEELIAAHKALIIIVEREDFGTMATERIPVVIAQVTARLRRLGQLLRNAQSTSQSRTLIVH